MKEIGIATMEYDRDGNIIASQSSFKPSIEVSVEKIQDQLRQVRNSDDVDLLKYNATLIMSQWFSEVTNAELADREELSLHSEVIECVSYKDNKVKKCVIKFTLL